MGHSPLKIIFYGIESFSFQSNKKIKENRRGAQSAENITTDVKYMTAADNENLHKIEMKISVDSKGKEHPPYRLSLFIWGVFEIDESFAKESADFLVQINGPSILYGAAREYIFASTAHGRFGPYLLPSVSFRPELKQENDLDTE